MENKDEKYFRGQRRLMYADLVERVTLFKRKEKEMREGAGDGKFNRREFMNETYALLLKSHAEAVKRYFNVVEVKAKGDEECPKLLRYEFYRIAKEINPLNFERDANPKAPNWVPTKKSPESFNYKTHNKFANVYKKNRNKIVSDPESPLRSASLWGQQHGK